MTHLEIKHDLVKSYGYNITDIRETVFKEKAFSVYVEDYEVAIVESTDGSMRIVCFGNNTVLFTKSVNPNDSILPYLNIKYIKSSKEEKEMKERVDKFKNSIKDLLKVLGGIAIAPFFLASMIIGGTLIFITCVIYTLLFPITLPVWIITGFWYPNWIWKII